MFTENDNHYFEHYFDHMAATYLDEEIASSLIKNLQNNQLSANPSSNHPFGIQSNKMINDAEKKTIAALNGAEKSSIVWLQSASEAIATAILGIAGNYGMQKKHIITSTIEHQQTYKALDKLKTNGFIIDQIDVDAKTGLMDIDQLERKISDQTLLVTFHHINNETGSIQNIERICRIARKVGALSHIDCAQSIGKVHIDIKKVQPDFVSLSSHKCHGPKGIGALYMHNTPHRSLLSIFSNIKSFDQKIKNGTLSPALSMAMAMAIEKYNDKKYLKKNNVHIKAIKDHMLATLQQSKNIAINALSHDQIPHLLSITLPNTSQTSIDTLKATFNLSSFSACNQQSKSHVLKAIGIDEKNHLKTLRIAFCPKQQVSHCEKLKSALQSLTI